MFGRPAGQDPIRFMSILPKRNAQTPGALRRVMRFLLRSLVFLVLALVILGIALYSAILIQPQRVSSTAQMALQKLQPHLAPYHLGVETVEIHIEKFGGPVMIDGRGLSFGTDEALLAESPRFHAELGLNLLPLPQLQLRDLMLQAPVLHGKPELLSGEDNIASTSVQRMVAWQKFKKNIRHINRIIAFRQLRVENARVVLPHAEGVLEGQWSMAMSYKLGLLKGQLALNLPNGEETGTLALSISGNPDAGSARIEGRLKDFRPAWLHSLPVPAWVKGADYPVAMTLHGRWKRDALDALDATIDASPGTFHWPEMFAERLNIRHITAKAHVGPGAREITLKDIMLELPDAMIHAQIEMKETKDGYGMNIQSHFPELPTDRLAAYWPLKMAPITRIWAVDSIHRGMIRNAELSMQLHPEDLEAPSLPKDALRAKMQIEGVEVRYLPEHPPVRNISGLVTFTGQDMRLDIEGADYLTATHIDKGWLAIPSFDAPETALDAEFDLHTVAKDGATLFATREIDLARELHLTQEASGSATGNVGIHAIIFSSQPNPTPEYYAEQFKYRVKAKLEHVSQPLFLGDTDIADADVQIVADNAAMTAEGNLKLNGVPAKLSLTSNFETHATVTKVGMMLPAQKLPAFGYPVQQGVSGTIGVDASIAAGKAGNVTDALLDLTPTVLSLPVIGLTKPAGEKAQLKITTRILPNGGTAIDPIGYTGKDASMNGSVVLDAKGTLTGANIGNLRFGRQNATIRYGKGADGVTELFVRGVSLDLMALRATPEKEKNKPSPKPGNPLDPGAIRADVNLSNLWLTEKTPIQQFRAKMTCDKTLCQSADIQGQVAEDKEEKINATAFSMRIFRENGARKFRLESEDGGRLMAAADVTDHIRGGKTNIEGTYDDASPTHALIGKIRMEEFYVRQAPLLTKILSLTSPTGIVDALLGKGIGFDGFASAMTFEGGTVRLKKAHASGPGLGLTVEDASLQLGSTEMQIKGTVIPAYMLNSVIGKIPVVGDLLMGGKNQGLIATRFSVSGTYEDPSVNVNPLSILTPGFLRGVFDVFDSEEQPEGSTPIAQSHIQAEKSATPAKRRSGKKS